MNIGSRANNAVIMVTAAILLVACSGEHDKKVDGPEITPVMAEDATLDVTVTETPDKKLIVSGRTNLPNGIELFLTIRSSLVGLVAEENEIAVVNGAFTTGALGWGEKLDDAIYTVEVLTPIAMVQPPHIQKIIGENGEHLSGIHVRPTEFGSNIVSVEVIHQIGSDESVQKNAQELHARVVNVTTGLANLLAEGKKMERLRATDRPKQLRKCGKKMRAFQPQAKELKAEAEELPFQYRNLVAAAMEMNACVSCFKGVMAACSRAESNLNEEN